VTREPRWPPAPTGARTLLLGLGLAVLAFCAYLPALRQGFVLGDDHNNLVFNPHWRGLGREQLAWMWTTFHLGHWQPLSWMTFGAEYGLWGLTPGEAYPPEGPRYHLLNLLLHAGSAWLAFELFRRLLRAAAAAPDARAIDLCAAAGTALWAVHPLRVENVAWATERRDVLAGCLLLATLLAWLAWRRTGRGAALALALVLYALSLASKAWGMTLPAVLVLIEVGCLARCAGARAPRAWLRAALATWPFAVLAVPIAVVAARAQASIGAALGLDEHGALARVAQAAWGLCFYVRKTLWPAGLSTHYLLERDLDPFALEHLACAAALLATAVAAWLLRRRLPALGVALLAYAVLVAPVLGFLQSGLQKVADRYAYLAALPLALLLAGGLAALARRRPRAGRAALGACALLLAPLFVATWRQTEVWRDSVTLYERAVAVEPDNYLARMNLATALREAGDAQRALEHTRASIELEPGPRNVYARFHLGLLLQQAGDFEGALAAWRAALEVEPADALTLELAGNELAARGRAAEALELYETALTQRPDAAQVRERLALLRWGAGERERALELWRAGLERDPRWAAGHEGLGRAALARREPALAEQHLRRALELDAQRIESLVLLGRVLRSGGRVPEAEALWLEALRRAPGHRQAQTLLEQSRAASAQGR
jgi:tetratricopeptide (TPR) repeat protein